ncbi:2,5-diketo-D-gluconate reductase A [Luteibacter rhizovicinus]|uniref:2,5-diketo-D-gluconate reductase A n=1 Tax=Luteibacter rhizovicinus TaxID=242606 RepID=A0A4R3YLT6_9GAMM|nr:aldo/keto reductase [Luteibacter rhizovicinus]TCV93256.1 2,5-diketo-D-gluconate reductase A [Luteibacter rhizovicinus]
MTQHVPMMDLNDGRRAPQLGFGVWQIDDALAADAVASALKAGYRSIDTAAIYGNESGVGEGIVRSGVAREDIYLTTKLWNADQGYDKTLKAFDASLKRLGTDYADLYLIHWPVPSKDLYVETWKAFIRLREEGRLRSVGVSNFQPTHLERIIGETGVVPVVNQIELHPDFGQREVAAFNADHHIVTESWSPLGQGGDMLKNPVLAGLAKQHGKSVAQVVLRWHIQRGYMVIPKSQNPERIAENFQVFDFELSAEQMRSIDGLDAGNRIGPHPDHLD